jgi:hypothetical protein
MARALLAWSLWHAGRLRGCRVGVPGGDAASGCGRPSGFVEEYGRVLRRRRSAPADALLLCVAVRLRAGGG